MKKFYILFITIFFINTSFADCSYKNKDYWLWDKKDILISIWEKILTKNSPEKILNILWNISSNSKIIEFYKDFFSCKKDISYWSISCNWNKNNTYKNFYDFISYWCNRTINLEKSISTPDCSVKWKTTRQLNNDISFKDYLLKSYNKDTWNIVIKFPLDSTKNRVFKDKNTDEYFAPEWYKSFKIYIPKWWKISRFFYYTIGSQQYANLIATFIKDWTKKKIIIDKKKLWSTLYSIWNSNGYDYSWWWLYLDYIIPIDKNDDWLYTLYISYTLNISQSEFNNFINTKFDSSWELIDYNCIDTIELPKTWIKKDKICHTKKIIKRVYQNCEYNDLTENTPWRWNWCHKNNEHWTYKFEYEWWESYVCWVVWQWQTHDMEQEFIDVFPNTQSSQAPTTTITVNTSPTWSTSSCNQSTQITPCRPWQ